MSNIELRDRTCGAGVMPASSFLANSDNWRIHPLHQQKSLEGVLRDVGFVSRVIVNKRTDVAWGDRRYEETLVDGHARVELALSHGDDTLVPYEYVDLDPNEEAIILATFDPLAAMAVTDQKMLDDLIASTSTNDKDVQILLDELSSAQEEELYGHREQDEATDLLAKWGIEEGQVWNVPSGNTTGRSHKIYCRDARETRKTSVLASDISQLALIDPPQNIGAYDNDNLTEEEYATFIKEILDECARYSQRQIVIPGLAHYQEVITWKNPYFTAPWVKPVTQTKGKISKFNNFEQVLMFGDEFEWLAFMGDGWKRKRVNDVFQYPPTEKVIGDYPNAKPLAFFMDLIDNYTETGDIIYDPFLGSGTTLIAAEKTGRICYGTEISPRYIAIALERAVRECGLQPRLEV